LLFKKPVRRDVLIGTGLAVVATFGYQGAIQWVPSWIAAMLHAQGSREVIPQVSLVTTTLTTGGIIGCLCLPYVADRWGRRHALFIYFLGALLSVPTTFLLARELSHAVIATPIMGFFAAGVTTGFAIYFPELFPTAIRATAQGFCFNFARFFSAAGPLLAGVLTSAHGSFAPAIATIGSVYFIGLIILIFARETKGQALPD
jgi:MFS family permease